MCRESAVLYSPSTQSPASLTFYAGCDALPTVIDRGLATFIEVSVRSLVDKVALGQTLFEYFGVFLSLVILPLLYKRLFSTRWMKNGTNWRYFITINSEYLMKHCIRKRTGRLEV